MPRLREHRGLAQVRPVQIEEGSVHTVDLVPVVPGAGHDDRVTGVHVDVPVRVGRSLDDLYRAAGRVAHAHGPELWLLAAEALDSVEPGVSRVEAAWPLDPVRNDNLLTGVRVVADQLRARLIWRSAVARPVAVEEPVVVVGPAWVNPRVYAPVFSGREIDDMHFRRRLAARSLTPVPVRVARVTPVRAPALDIVVVRLVANGRVVGQPPDAEVPGARLLDPKPVDRSGGRSRSNESHCEPAKCPGSLPCGKVSEHRVGLTQLMHGPSSDDTVRARRRSRNVSPGARAVNMLAAGNDRPEPSVLRRPAACSRRTALSLAHARQQNARPSGPRHFVLQQQA